MQDWAVNAWNMSDAGDELGELMNATNNALERYNRRLGEQLGLHPSLQVFCFKLEQVHLLQFSFACFKLQFAKIVKF